MWLCLGEYRGICHIKPFLKYCEARLQQELETYSYRVYMTDSIKYRAENKSLNKRWCDLVHPQKVEEIDADAIILDVIDRAGLEVT